jgi:serine/threonine protein kinase
MTLKDLLIIGKIGKGRCSNVYKAINMKTGEKIAVKKCDNNEKGLMEREIRGNAELRHRNIIQTRGWFKEEESYYILYELATLGDLWEYIYSREEKLTEEKVKMILTGVIQAVSYMHSKKWIHRDIKMENVLLFKGLKGKICDLEFAIDSSHENPTRRVGTIEYMSPEILSCERPKVDGTSGYTEQTDVWSIGVMVYECLHKETPFSGNDFNEMTKNIATKEITFNESLSEQAKDFITACLQRDQQQRIKTRDMLKHEWFSKNVLCCL